MRNPFTFPEGNIQVAFSGGRTSAYMLHRLTRAEMHNYMARQGDWALSTEGALCQRCDGECTA